MYISCIGIATCTVNFSTFAKKGTRLLNHSVAASKAWLSQVHVHMHVVQRQLIYLTTICGIRLGQVDCKGAEIHCTSANMCSVFYKITGMLINHKHELDMTQII